MRSTLLTVALGLAAGIGGAGIFTVLRPQRMDLPVPPAQREPARPPMVVPSGWDPALLARLGRVEEKLANVQSDTKAPEEGPPPESHQSEAFQREKARSYQQDLANQEQKLADHAGEPIDQSWADGQTAAFARGLSPLVVPGVASLSKVDCRSKTCVVQLTYASPAEALAQRGAFQQHAAVPGCQGFTSALVPPTGDGPYDMIAVYNCR